MQCRFCGATLIAGAAYCPGCGKPANAEASEFSSYEYNSDEQPEPFQLPGQAPTQSPNPTPVPMPASNNMPRPTTPLQQSPLDAQVNMQQPAMPAPFSPNQPSYVQPQFYSNPQMYQGTLPFAPGNLQQPPTMYQPQIVPQALPQKQSGFSPTVVVLLVVLALVIGAGGVFAYFAISRGSINPNQTNGGNTSKPTATLQSSPTLNTSDPLTLYTQATSGTPALNDPLNASNPNNWQTLGGNGACTFSGKAMDATAPQSTAKDTVASCLATSTNFSNFAYQVHTTIIQGDAAGVLFRTDIVNNRFYLFGINSNGVYILSSGQYQAQSGWNSKFLSGGTSASIKTGLNQDNVVTIIAIGSNIYMYINQQYIASVNDSTAKVGAIGALGENTLGGPVDASFSSIQVWQL